MWFFAFIAAATFGVVGMAELEQGTEQAGWAGVGLAVVAAVIGLVMWVKDQ